MSELLTRQLLLTLAQYSQKQREKFSKEEIRKKITEIKYLAAQRNVPKLTLRREILQLECKVERLFEVEKEILQEKKYHSQKVAGLKRQLTDLKKKIASSTDKDIHQKVDRLNYLLAECVSKSKIKEEVGLQEKIFAVSPSEERPGATAITIISPDEQQKIIFLEHRLEALKNELEISKHLEKNPAVIKEIESKINLIDDKLKKIQQGTNTEFSPEVKHTMIFNPPVGGETLHLEELPRAQPPREWNQADLELEKELPLPPPPKMPEKQNKKELSLLA